MKLHEGMAKALIDNGLTTLFGVIGDGNLFLVDSYVKQHGGNYVPAANEAGAVLMALGHSLRSNAVGVATITHGPALTNAATALTEGTKGRLPIVVICGDTAVEDRMHSQSIDQRELIKATGAGVEQLRSVKTFAQDLATSIRRAVNERRPIVLNMPIELQWQDVDYAPVKAFMPVTKSYVPEGDDMDAGVGIIATAKRPVILAGRGAIHAESRSALLRLAERIGAPVCTTLRAKGLFRGQPNDLGICGTVSTPAASEIIAASDCIIAFGASLTKHTTLDGTFLKGKRVVQCNSEAADIGVVYRVDVGLVGDPALVADKIIEWLDTAEIPGSGYFDGEMQQRLCKPPVITANRDERRPETLDFESALQKINAFLPKRRNLVTDGGRYITMVWSHIEVPDPQSFLYSTNFGSIGLGMGYSIGASFAEADRPTVLFIGDGGFMLGGLVEFHTAVKTKRDLVVVVCNDAAYGAEHIQFKDRGMDASLALCEWPDFASVANSLGGRGVTVKTLHDLEAAEQAIEARDTPILIDLHLDTEFVHWIK